MKVDMKSGCSSQRGLVPIIIIVILAVVGTGGFLLYNNSKSFSNSPATSNNQQVEVQSPSQENLGLDKIENESYTFYYPKGYVTVDPEKDILINNYTVGYKNPNSKATLPETIVLRVSKTDQKHKVADFQICNGFAESQRKSSNEKIEVSVVTEKKFNGCKIESTTPIDGVNDSVVSIDNWLWYKDLENSYSVYRLTTNYYANASKDQVDALDVALDLFTLK